MGLLRKNEFGKSQIQEFNGPWIFLGQFGVFLNNISRKLPVRSNLVGYVVASGLGITIGEYVRYKLYEYKAEELATIKHYIMLHPEKFPEPEPMKYGDKRVFYPWIPNRRPGIG